MAEAAAEPRASVGDWIAVAAGSLGALMATLDISITNSALPQIQGSIGATGTEGTWISTGYLMSEIVMIPLTAWLTRVFGLRKFLLVNAVLFSGFSMMCGLSHTLAQMIIGRIGQGFAGGAMIPTAQTIVRTRLPRHQMPIGMTMFGLIVLLGPLFGPVVGGRLAEDIDWSWCFFVNLPVCAALVLLLYVGLPAAKAHWGEFINADWLGILGLAAGLSSLTVVLEEGQRERWFDSRMIIWLSVLAAAGIAVMALGQFVARKPIVRLELLANKSYASVIFIVFTVGAGLYCVSYLVPQFLSNIAGYNAAQSGDIMLLAGLPVLPDDADPAAPPRQSRSADHGHRGALAVRRELHARYLPDRSKRRPRLLRLADSAGPGTDVRDDAAQSGIDVRGIPGRGRRCGGPLQHGAEFGRFGGTRPARRVHRPPRRVSRCGDPRVGHREFCDWPGSHGDERRRLSRTARRLRLRAPPSPRRQLAAQIYQQAAVITYSETFYVLGVAMLLCIPLALVLRNSAPRAPGPAAQH